VYKAIHQLDIDIRYFPMNKTVSGDYYNVSITPGRTASLTIADASGHGMQAALTTMQIDILSKESEMILSPNERLEYLNNNWMDNKLSHSLFTCFIVDFYEDYIVCASAGHTAQLLIQQESSSMKIIKPSGKLLGFGPDSKYEKEIIPVKPGDFLFLFTDGLFEQFNANGEEYGEERIREFIKNYVLSRTKKTATRFINEAIINEVERFRKEEPVNDDITMIGIRIQ